MKIMRFLRSEDGQGLVEYALVLVLVAVVVIAILALLGPYIGEWLNTAAEWFRQLLGNGS
jgi:pilus assembly protein Flp/PilA